MRFISEEFREKIETRITEYERQCAIEFVPVIVRSSGHYATLRLNFALFVFAIGLALIRLTAWGLSWELEILVCAAASALVFLVSGWGWLLGRCLPLSLKRLEVEEAAALHFLKEEVFATPQRTGILIYISMLERSVYLLADKGLTQKIPAPEWSKLGGRLASDFHRQSAGVTFIEALDGIVKRAAKDFPANGVTKPQLPNKIREE